MFQEMHFKNLRIKSTNLAPSIGKDSQSPRSTHLEVDGLGRLEVEVVDGERHETVGRDGEDAGADDAVREARVLVVRRLKRRVRRHHGFTSLRHFLTFDNI